MSIRYASSLVVKRRDQVFLARRSPKLRFFGDFWAFPGGAVTSRDREFSAGDSDGAHRVALAREMFEELGIWLEEGELSLDCHKTVRDQLRRNVLAEESRFYDAVDRKRLLQSVAKLRQIAHLLTPAYHPIRFDTHFYLLELESEGAGSESQPSPGNLIPEIWPGELVEGRFDTPDRWLEAWRREELRIAAPVLLLLQTVSRHGWEGAWTELDALSTTLGEGEIHTIFYNPAAQILPVESRTRPPATHTNAILIGEDPTYLVDPGCIDVNEQNRLISAVEGALQPGLVAGRTLRAILLTHHHPDHVAGASRLAEHFGIPVWAHAETAARLRGQVNVSTLLEDGDRLPLGVSPDGCDGWELEVHFTPGHAPGHLAFFEQRYRTLIAGDLVSTISSILVGTEDGNMIEYLDSLRAMAELDPDLICPGHGPAATKAKSVLLKQIEHRAAREASVVEILKRNPRTPLELATEIYHDLPEEALPLAAASVQSILKKLETEGVARRAGDSWSLSGSPFSR